MKMLIHIFLFTILILPTLAFQDPTDGKPFFPWVWQEQLKPTFKKSIDKKGLTILASGAAASLVVHEYDHKIRDFNDNKGNLWMNKKTAEDLGKIGHGPLAIAVVGAQFIFEDENAVKTTQALVLTSVSHMSLTSLVRRDRPHNKKTTMSNSSYPSGHTSSAFALAGSLAYSYGLKGAVPGYLIATAIAVARVKENRHWASDVVGGAFLGTFWARAAFESHSGQLETFVVVPVPVDDGLMINGTKSF